VRKNGCALIANRTHLSFMSPGFVSMYRIALSLPGVRIAVAGTIIMDE
jgi:hypothetical protein